MAAGKDPFHLSGQVLDGQFRVDSVVGEGGFSAVYKGFHLGLEEPIAIKCLKLPTTVGAAMMESFLRRFRDESKLLYRLSQGNLNIVRSIASGTVAQDGQAIPYMVLEWLEGVSLGEDFDERRARGAGARSLSEVMGLFEHAADALAYAHAQGVIHRDLNPGNLFLARRREGGVRMKVLDFGVAKVVSDHALELGPRAPTLGQIRIFSPGYAAPEQFDATIAPASPATDVYAFALILTEALLGRPVVEGVTLGDYFKQTLTPTFVRTPRALGAGVGEAVEAVFARALSLDPSERPADVGRLWAELQQAARGPGARDPHPTVRQIVPPSAGPASQEEPIPSTDPQLGEASTLPAAIKVPGPPAPAPAAPGGTSLANLKSTVRMASPPPPGPSRSTAPLLQGAAMPPPAGTPSFQSQSIRAYGGPVEPLSSDQVPAPPAAPSPAPAQPPPPAVAVPPAGATRVPTVKIERASLPAPGEVTPRRTSLLVLGLAVFFGVLLIGGAILALLVWRQRA